MAGPVLSDMEKTTQSVFLSEYAEAIRPTDFLSEDDLRPVLMGLFGEVGSIMAPAKKLHREGTAYKGFRTAVEEEFGDALWYLAALARRTGNNFSDLFSQAVGNGTHRTDVAAGDKVHGSVVHVFINDSVQNLDDALLELGQSAAALLTLKDQPENSSLLLYKFAQCYLHALDASNLTFSQVVQRNLAKTRGRFLEPDTATLPNFDFHFEKDEQIPSKFEITITQRKSGQSFLQMNGVVIGDPLTDNILDSDGYRFHDVFHLAHAAILHWSPVFRALIKHKRKSEKIIDEAQDGGRAIVVEEGLTAWLFARAKEINFFAGQSRVSFDLLKTVHQFVEGYEVDSCPLKLWEKAILDGYSVFRLVRENNGGIIICDRISRTISYKSASGSLS